MTPQKSIERIEHLMPELPEGRGDRFAGYGIMGVTFRSGNVLAMRRFPASSIGPGYTCVWHRNPAGRWTFYSTVSPDVSCARYFARPIDRKIVTLIDTEWLTPNHLRIRAGTDIAWDVVIGHSILARLVSWFGQLMPQRWLRTRLMIRVLELAARVGFGAGRVALTGVSPNLQWFMVNPRRIWTIAASHAVIDGHSAGPMAPLPAQASLGDFLIPHEGFLVAGSSSMTDDPDETDFAERIA